MKKTDPGAILKDLIKVKETQRRLEEKVLKVHFHKAYQSLKPSNIIKSTIKEVTSDSDLKTGALTSVLGFATGAITKKLFIGSTTNIVTKLLGGLLEMGVSGIITRHGDKLVQAAQCLFKKDTRSEPEHGERI